MIRPYCSSLILLLFFFSCATREETVPVFKSTYTDFENSLLIDGVVEPVRSAKATSPPFIEGEISFLVEDGTFVKEGDVVAIIDAQGLQLRYDQLLTSLENAETGLSKTRADLNLQYALLEAQVRTNEADTEIARLDSLQLKYSTPNQVRIKELNLERVTIQKERYEKKIQALSIIQQSEIRKRELELLRLSNWVDAAKEELDKLTIRAPKDGMAIRGLSPFSGKKLQVGDPVWHLTPLINLPDFSEMKVKIKATETDYKQISLNDSVIYTFDAMPDNIAWGKITMKHPIGQPMKEDSKVKFFEIEASVDSALVLPEPGFTANCRIILQQERNAIVIPQIAVFEKDSMKVVYVKNKRDFEARQIQTGLSSSKETIVVAGLDKGEEISLSKPPVSRIKRTVLLPDSLINK